MAVTPFTETLGHVDAALAHRRIDAGLPAGPGWLSAADLLADGAEALGVRLRTVHDSHGGGLPDVAASYFMGWYAGAVAAPVIGAFVLERRVPDVGAANVSVHAHEGGWFDRTALHDSSLTVLAGDPAAGAPGNRTATDLASLRAVLVSGLVTHLTPVVTAVRSRAPLGLRALWGTVADACAAVFVELGRDGDAGARCRTEADAFLDAASPPLRARPRWVVVDHEGVDRTFMRRGACCLAYKVPGDHGYCTSCPLVDDTERDVRLRTYLAQDGS